MLNGNDSTYLVFGLVLRTDVPIPGLTHVEPIPDVPFVRIQLCALGRAPYDFPRGKEELSYTSSYLGLNAEPALRIWKIAGGSYLHLAYSDGMEFWLDREGENIWGIWPPKSSIEDAATYLLGPVLGLLLRLRGVTCLHASAVAFGGRAVAFVGSAGAGKSTTAAALARRGHSVLSDDIVALSEVDGTFRVMPAYPYLSLWPESVSMLYGSAEAMPRFIGNWDKRYVANGSGGVKFEESALQLGAVYLLAERAEDLAPRIEVVPAQQALISLVANTYATNTLDSHMRAMEFEVLGRLVSAVPIRKIYAHEDPTRIDDLCRLIGSDFGSLPPQTAIAVRRE
jgi:hypothetical protein